MVIVVETALHDLFTLTNIPRPFPDFKLLFDAMPLNIGFFLTAGALNGKLIVSDFFDCKI